MPKPMTPNRNIAVTFVGDGMRGGADVLKRHVKFHPNFENKSARLEAAIPSPEEDLADPATTMAVPDGNVTGSLETAPSPDAQQTWDQLSQGLWSFSPPSGAPDEPGDAAAAANQTNQLPLDQNGDFIYEQANHVTSFVIPHLDATDIDASTNVSSVPLQGWDFMESAPTSLASSVLHDQDHTSDVSGGIRKAPLISEKNMDVYFSKVHPFWPILHAPTFRMDKVSDILLASMTMLADWLCGGPDHFHSYTTVFEAAATSQLLADPDLNALQALFLCVVYATYRPVSSHAVDSVDPQGSTLVLTRAQSEKGMMTWAVRLNSILISTCRSFGVFSDERALPHQLEDDALAAWIAREHLHRLAFAVLRIDTYLSLILDHPPSLRYEEMYIPLPKSAQLWEATSDGDRRCLQYDEPAGRDKALFSYLMRDAICGKRLPCRLTKDDCHMMLLGLQSGVWEAAREAHSFASGVLDTKLTPGVPIQTWRARLEQWRAQMEDDASIQKDYFEADGSHQLNNTDILSPVTLLVLHIASLKMHAPLSILQMPYSKRISQASSSSPSANSQGRLKVWHESSCPRIAVWNAARIARVASQELHNISAGSKPVRLLNPLIIPGLLMSAVVVYSYVQNTVACGSCCAVNSDSRGGGGQLCPPPQLDLGLLDDEVPHDNPSVIAWKDCGIGLATFGAERIPLCKCRTAEIAAFFERLLAVDSMAKDSFLGFTKEASTSIT
ncbi:hypothetical protein PG984_002408 [Apiospora sp. TS-2023a]